MQWADFYPYVLPYVLGCPEPTVDHHLKMAAREFSRRTQCIVGQFESFADGFDAAVELDLPSGHEIEKVQCVAVDGRVWLVVAPQVGVEIRTGAPAAGVAGVAGVAFVSGFNQVSLLPIQPAGTVVVVDAVFVQSMDAAAPADGLEPHAREIAEMAIASIMMVPGQTFTNVAHAAQLRGLCDQRVMTVAAKIARGSSRARVGSRATYL